MGCGGSSEKSEPRVQGRRTEEQLECIQQQRRAGQQLTELEQLWEQGEHQKAVDLVIAALIRLNPQASDAELRKRGRLMFHNDVVIAKMRAELEGVSLAEAAVLQESPQLDEAAIRAELEKQPHSNCLHEWDLSHCNLARLPEEFGTVRTRALLDLSFNPLASLPHNFGQVQVGGSLSLSHCQLTQLPESFANVKVGGDLVLGGGENTLSSDSIPASFPNVHGEVMR